MVATGLATEVGRIASLIADAPDPKTPLELRIRQFGHYLVGAAIALFVLVMAVGLLRGLPLAEILMVAISQMVSMVPEGLPVAMTIALAVGMQRMARRGAIVRRLAAVETLGCTSVICSDKTGTLTKNEMTVTALWLPGGRKIEITGAGYSPEGTLRETGHDLTPNDIPELRPLLEAVALCNDARLVPPDATDPRWRALGDPTEAALLTLAMKGGVELEPLRQEMPRRAEIPFDSTAKMMATQNGRDARGRIFLKGAPEMVLELCATARRDGQREPVNDAFRREVEAASGEMGATTLRLLGVAEVDECVLEEGAGFAQLKGRATFLGLVGQMDPPRDEVRDAVAECRDAGIRPVMVTGDHKTTGLAVARTLGLARAGELALDGRELEQMPEEDLRANLDRISVFARVHPAQKLRIVEAFQARKKVVAMTGDGVNDAPALARADVGVAMGITGTEVAKGAAKIVITDDNFATIVKAVEEGRLVYRNLKKVILLPLRHFHGRGFPAPERALSRLPAPAGGRADPVDQHRHRRNGDGEPHHGTAGRRRNEAAADRAGRTAPQPHHAQARRAHDAGHGDCRVRLLCLALLDRRALRPGAQRDLHRAGRVPVVQCAQLPERTEVGPELEHPHATTGCSAASSLGNVLHFLVIYTEPMNRIFHTVPIPTTHFFLIGAVASLVLWVEEIRKFFARRRARAEGMLP